MSVREGRVFLGGTSVSIVDASDASNPHVVGSFTPGWTASSITLAAGVLFALESATFPGRSDQPPWLAGALHVLDVSDEANIREMNQVEVGLVGAGAALATLGPNIFLAEGSGGGFRVFDATSVANPVGVGRFDIPGSVGHVDVTGSEIYVTSAPLAGPPKLKILDLTDTLHIASQAEFDIPGVDVTVSADGTTLYVGAGFVGGVRIVDASNPAQPAEIGAFKTPGNVYKTTIRNGLAYVADGGSGLTILDVSDPSNIQELGSYNTPAPKPTGPAAGVAYDVAVQDHVAFLAQGWRGLRILDVGSPANPTEIGAVATKGDAHAVAVDGSFAYVVSGSLGSLGRLDIVDISDPAAPTIVDSLELKGNAEGVAVADQFVYVPVGPNVQGLQLVSPAGIQVIDVADPGNPVEVAFSATPAAGTSVYVASGRVYVGDADAGLLVLTALNRGG
jgi:hypothetical protein